MDENKYQFFYTTGWNSFISSIGKLEEIDFSKFSQEEINAFVDGWNSCKSNY